MKSKNEILIVNEVSENIKIAINILKSSSYNFSYALSSKQAIEILKSKRFDLIILDVVMPDIDGFALCKIIKNSPSIRETPVIFFTDKIDIESVEHGFEVGAVDYIKKPFHPVELQSRVKSHIELYKHKKELNKKSDYLAGEIKVVKDKYSSDLLFAQKEIMSILTELIQSDAENNASHNHRVALMARKLASLEGNLTQQEIDILYICAPLYDIGKILIDKKILNKHDKLSDEEIEIMKGHTTLADGILRKSQIESIQAVRVIAHQHHENYDGTGYPQALSGDEIHIFARIVSICDVLESLTHASPFRKAWSFEEASKYIIESSGTKFDPRLVDIFSTHLEMFKEITEEEST
ncbi:response regulator [Sulfurimonas aquatica]|uniref:Response regulator n=1 Tax=Sulfurimonas aquatica TaxID=2672570 RepID=A0A975GCM1_9BACT|nr:HD domain-containing phosphohydrolase [Sulfurimonas aquatica]QSZ41856.1 response regulator [Sulfurimonas aquatica]